MFKNTTTTLLNFQDSKSAFQNIHLPFDGYLHMSWKLLDGKVLSFEFMPENYPAGSYIVWENQQEYLEAIEDVSWIMENATGAHKFYCSNCDDTFYTFQKNPTGCKHCSDSNIQSEAE